jgi:hypothetical protein
MEKEEISDETQHLVIPIGTERWDVKRDTHVTMDGEACTFFRRFRVVRIQLRMTICVRKAPACSVLRH